MYCNNRLGRMVQLPVITQGKALDTARASFPQLPYALRSANSYSGTKSLLKL